MTKPSNKNARKGTRGQLLKAARRELVKSDGNLELAKVAKRAGVSDGLTYYHFGNKAGLIQALVDDFYRAMDDCVTAVEFAGDTWAEREQRRVHAMVDFFYKDPCALIVATRLRSEPSLVQEEAARAVRLNRLGASNIAQAQRSGEIASSTNPLLLVSMVLSGVTEGVRTALNTEPVTPIEEAKREIWSFVSRAVGLNG